MGRKPTHAQDRAVAFDDQAYQLLATAASNSGQSKSAYAGAAVRYFAELGLDPTQQTAGAGMAQIMTKLAHLSMKIDLMQETIRQQSADIGNRLVGIWRVLEKNLYTHLATEQHALLLYLEANEENILSRSAHTESEFLWPLMERLIRNGVDSTGARRMASDLLQFMGVLVPEERVPDYTRNALNNEFSRERDEEVARQAREFLEVLKQNEWSGSNRPALTVAPVTAIPTKAKPPTDSQPTTS